MEDPFELPPDVLRRVPLFAEISKVLSWTGGPVNWDLGRQVAVSIAGAGADAPPEPADAESAAQHVRVAELWLAETAGIPVPTHVAPVRAATSADWAEHATATLAEIIDPVAAKVARAVSERAAGASGSEGMMAQALTQLAPMFLGMQAGSVIGAIGAEVVATYELGLPLLEDEIILVLPRVDALARDYELDPRDVRQWVALRAAASHMTLEGFPWVRTHFFALYHNYVASLDVDIAAGMERLESLDLSDPERLRDALAGEGLFATHSSPETEHAASRVSTFLSIVDAHAVHAVEAAATGRIGAAARVAETFARRAVEARGLRALAGFVGIEGPTRAREARAFAAAVRERGGWDTLNRIWEEPDAFPTDEELVDADAWLRRLSS